MLLEQFLEEPLPSFLLLVRHVKLMLHVLTRRVCLVSQKVLVVVQWVDRLATNLAANLSELGQTR